VSGLVINGAAVPVHYSSGDVTRERRTTVARRWSGAIAVAERSGVAVARSVEVRVMATASYPLASLYALQGVIESGGWLTVSGDVWGAEAQAEAQAVERYDGPLPDLAVLAFTLVERGAP